MTPCLDCGRSCAGPRCPAHQHSYGGAHQAQRKHWASIVALGHTPCARCHLPIVGAFDLDHIDGIERPSHPACNRGTRG